MWKSREINSRTNSQTGNKNPATVKVTAITFSVIILICDVCKLYLKLLTCICAFLCCNMIDWLDNCMNSQMLADVPNEESIKLSRRWSVLPKRVWVIEYCRNNSLYKERALLFVKLLGLPGPNSSLSNYCTNQLNEYSSTQLMGGVILSELFRSRKTFSDQFMSWKKCLCNVLYA